MIKNDVLIGEDGWLYLWSGGQKQFSHLMGAPIKSGSVDAFVDNIEGRKLYCASRSTNYLHVVFPSKPTVVTQFLPKDIRFHVKSLFNQHYAKKSHGKEYIFYGGPLLNEKSQQTTFKKQDTHMTDFGSGLICSEILRRLGYKYDAHHHVRWVKRKHAGDLMRMLGETEPAIENFAVSDGDSSLVWDNRKSLEGNTGNIAVYHNVAAQSGFRLLAIGDSFLKDCLPLLSQFFKDILYVRSSHFQPSLIDMMAPDAVVTANAERYLSAVTPDRNGHDVVMEGYGANGYMPDDSFTNSLRAQLAWRNFRPRYESWRSGACLLCVTRLGAGRLKNQIQRLGETSSFRVLGNDPQILFPSTCIEPMKVYKFTIDMDVEDEGFAQVFWSIAPGAPDFSEANSSKANLKKGRQEIQFILSNIVENASIRFDPCNRPGNLKIHSMSFEVSDGQEWRC